MDHSGPQLQIDFPEPAESAANIKIAQIQDRARERQERDAIAAGLPDWPENKRGLPNGALRSALFGISPKERRTYAVERHIASIDGLEVFITRGPNLMQHHLDVWEQCLRLGKMRTRPSRTALKSSSLAESLSKS